MDRVKALKAALTDRLHIDQGTHPIHVALEDDFIVIEGMVDNVSQKKSALLIAMGLPSSGVIDRLRVRPSTLMSDDQIRDHLRDAIEAEGVLGPGKIKIEVNNSVVDLEGEVVSLSHKRLAGVLAWWVPGSTDVINSIEVNPPEDDTGDEIRDALLQVLEKDRLVDASSITVSVKDWGVTLGGIARSQAEKDAAEDDAWYVWGVNSVINNIEV